MNRSSDGKVEQGVGSHSPGCPGVVMSTEMRMDMCVTYQQQKAVKPRVDFAEMCVLYVLHDSVCTTMKALPHVGHFLSSEISENITGLKT